MVIPPTPPNPFQGRPDLYLHNIRRDGNEDDNLIDEIIGGAERRKKEHARKIANRILQQKYPQEAFPSLYSGFQRRRSAKPDPKTDPEWAATWTELGERHMDEMKLLENRKLIDKANLMANFQKQKADLAKRHQDDMNLLEKKIESMRDEANFLEQQASDEREISKLDSEISKMESDIATTKEHIKTMKYRAAWFFPVVFLVIFYTLTFHWDSVENFYRALFGFRRKKKN